MIERSLAEDRSAVQTWGQKAVLAFGGDAETPPLKATWDSGPRVVRMQVNFKAADSEPRRCSVVSYTAISS